MERLELDVPAVQMLLKKMIQPDSCRNECGMLVVWFVVCKAHKIRNGFSVLPMCALVFFSDPSHLDFSACQEILRWEPGKHQGTSL